MAYTTPIPVNKAIAALEGVYGKGNVKRSRRQLRIYIGKLQVSTRAIVKGKALM